MKSKKKENSEYSADRPVSKIGEDKFQRHPFSKRIAQTIINRSGDDCLVLGIYGAWGEGKTSVINFIEGELLESSGLIILKFNPWRYADENTLLIQFFNQFANALGGSLKKNKEKVGEIFQEYGKFFNIDLFGINAGEAAEKAGEKMAKVSVETLKSRIEEIIHNSKKKVVVFIDDIDRLDKTEIHSIFRLVKLTADFKNTTYVLSFDEAMVSAAIGERFGSGNEKDGRNFLEKIIQVPLNIPAAQPKDLMDFCFHLINKTLDDNKIDFSKEDNSRFVNDFMNSILIRLDTPRLAVRYVNALSFSIPLLMGEVNIVDLMLIEAIKIFYPNHYTFIKNNPEYFINSYEKPTYDRGSEQVEEKIKFIKDHLERLGNDLTSKQKKEVKGLLTSLFPLFEGAFRSIGYSDDTYKSWIKEKRIASSRYFSKYFSYSTPKGDLPDIVFAEFVENIRQKNINAIAEDMSSLIVQSSPENFLFRIRVIEDDFNLELSTKIAKAICSISDLFPHPQDTLIFSFTTPKAQAAFFVKSIVWSVSDNKKRLALAKELFNSCKEFGFADELYSRIRSDKENQLLSEEELFELEGLLLDRALKESKGSAIFEKFPLYTVYLLNHWSKKDRKAMMKYLDEIFIKEPSKFIDLLRCFASTMRSTSHPEAYKTDLNKQNFEYLISALGKEYINNMIEKTIDKKELNAGEVIWMGHDPGQTDINIIRQYKYWHKLSVDSIKH